MKWQIGDVEIHQIVELENAGKIIQEGIREATAENIKNISWLYPYFADKDGNLKAQITSFLIKSNGKNILIDTCNGNDKVRTDLVEWSNFHTNYLEKLRKTGVSETEIDVVLSTHLHCDHVGWNTKLENGKWIPTFPNATYLFVKEEYDYWVTKPEKEVADDKDAFDDSVKPIIDAGLAEFVPSDYKIDNNISLVSTSGHTPGHVSIMIESKNSKALLSGDFMHHPCQFAYPEWTIEYDTYPEKAVESRKKMLSKIADTNTLLIGAHFSGPVAGKVKRNKNSYIFEI